jgi:AsmA protein
MKFDSFTARYGKSALVLDGALSNVIDYAVKPNATLTGDFNLKSGLIVADDFMAFASTNPAVSQTTKTSAATGVILVPANLEPQLCGRCEKR